MELLKTLYSEVRSLQDWVEYIVSQQGDASFTEIVLHDESDPDSYRTFLEKTIVTADRNYKLPTLPICSSQNAHQREIILRVIQRICEREGPGKNMLTLGFGPMSDDPDAYISSLPNVEYRYPNSCVNRLHYPHWKKLLTRIGDTLMEHLLEYTSVFTFVPPSCYIQNTGKPVYDLWPFKPGLTMSIPDKPKKIRGYRTQIDKMARRKETSKKETHKAIQKCQKKKNIICTAAPLTEVCNMKHSKDAEVCTSSGSTTRLPNTGYCLLRAKHSLDKDKHFKELQQEAIDYAKNNMKTSSEENVRTDFTKLLTKKCYQQNNDGSLYKPFMRKRKLSQMEADIDVAPEYFLTSGERQTSAKRKKTEESGCCVKKKFKGEMLQKSRINQRCKESVSHPNQQSKYEEHNILPFSQLSQQNELEKLKTVPFSQGQKLSPKHLGIQECHTESQEIMNTAMSPTTAKRTRIEDGNYCVDKNIRGIPVSRPCQDNAGSKKRRKRRHQKKSGHCHGNRNNKQLGKPYMERNYSSVLYHSGGFVLPLRRFHTYFKRMSLMCSKQTREQIPKSHILNAIPATRSGALSLYKSIFGDDTVLPETSCNVRVLIECPPTSDPSTEGESPVECPLSAEKESTVKQNSKVEIDTMTSPTKVTGLLQSVPSGSIAGTSVKEKKTQEVTMTTECASSDADNSICSHDNETPLAIHQNVKFIPDLVPILQTLIESHKQFPYRRILDFYNSEKCKDSQKRRKSPTVAKRTTSASNSTQQCIVSTATTQSGAQQNEIKRKSCDDYKNSKCRNIQRSFCMPRLDGVIFKRSFSRDRDRTTLLTKFLKKRNQTRSCSVTRLLSKYTAHRQVFLFLRRILYHVVTGELLGGKDNCRVLSKKLRTFVSMGKFDKYSLGQLMEGVQTKTITWLRKVKSSWVKRHLLAKVVYWLMTEIFMTVLKSFFYITESTVCRNRLFYYRKYVWRRIQTRGVQDLLKLKRIEKITEGTALKQLTEGTALGVASLRFIPKAKSLRTIVNLGRQPPSGSKQMIAINKQLLNLFQVLMYHKNKTPDLVRAAKFGTAEIYTAWKEFSQKQTSSGEELYFVKLDISSCFDCINKDKLLEIVEQILHNEEVEEYVVRRYVTIVSVGGQLRRRFHRKVSPLVEFVPDFTMFVKTIAEAENFRNIILSDQAVNQHEFVSSLMEQLKNHLNNNIIKIGRQYFAQKQGISQGSVLSTILCNLYYGHLEKWLFPVQADEVLIRIVDDSLFVTPHKQRAVDFLNKMIKGVPEYNFEINTDKVLINFCHTNQVGDPVPQVSSGWFPYCGMLFNTRHLYVSMDISRYSGSAISDTMSFDVSHEAGRALKRKLMFSLQPKNHVVYLDTEVNSAEVVITNCSKMFILTVLKFHCYNMHLPVSQRVDHNVGYFTELTLDLANFLYSQVVYILQHENPGKPVSTLPQNYMQWICLHSFLLKIDKHRNMYTQFHKSLHKLRSVIGVQLNKKEPGVVAMLLKLCGRRLPAEWKDILD